jgi:hypothetical protein
MDKTVDAPRCICKAGIAEMSLCNVLVQFYFYSNLTFNPSGQRAKKAYLPPSRSALVLLFLPSPLTLPLPLPLPSPIGELFPGSGLVKKKSETEPLLISKFPCGHAWM